MSRRQRRAQLERRRRAAVPGRRVATAGGLAIVATLLSGSVAEADTFTVTSTSDSGTGSLRAEIMAANADTVPTVNTIMFASTVTGSIYLGSVLPTITHPLYIQGPGAGVLTIHGGGTQGIFDLNSGTTTYDQISGLTLTGGNNTGFGGAIYSASPLTLFQDDIRGNTARYGGGVSANTLTVEASTISGNTANAGAGIGNNGALYLKYSTVAGNTATLTYGGGISQFAGAMTISESTISDNHAPSTTSIYGGGGGIYIDDSVTTAALKGTIVSGNTSGRPGPDIYTNTAAPTPTTASFSLIGSLSGSGITPDSTDLVGVDPLLGPLQNNGGPTDTMAPAFNSPVIDRGKRFSFDKVDQRGFTRPVDLPGYPNAPGGDGTDIGAVELTPAEVAPAVTGLTPSSGLPGSPVMISGSRLSTATSVLFGASAAPFTVNGMGALVATVPAGSGAVDVRVVTPGGETPVVAADQFTITAPIPPPPPPPPAPVVTKASFGNQAITVTTPSLSVCTSSTSRLPVTLTSSAITGSRAKKLKFSSAGFFVDGGVKHTRKKIKHLAHGKTKKIKVTTYRANLVVHHVPAAVSLKLAGLKAGSHALKIVVSYKKTVTKHHHKKTVTVTKTIRTTFKVC